MVQEYGEIYMITHPEIMESGNDSNQQVVFAEILDAYLHLLSTDYQLVSMARHTSANHPSPLLSCTELHRVTDSIERYLLLQ